MKRSRMNWVIDKMLKPMIVMRYFTDFRKMIVFARKESRWIITREDCSVKRVMLDAFERDRSMSPGLPMV